MEALDPSVTVIRIIDLQTIIKKTYNNNNNNNFGSNYDLLVLSEYETHGRSLPYGCRHQNTEGRAALQLAVFANCRQAEFFTHPFLSFFFLIVWATQWEAAWDNPIGKITRVLLRYIRSAYLLCFFVFLFSGSRLCLPCLFAIDIAPADMCGKKRKENIITGCDPIRRQNRLAKREDILLI